MKPFFPYSRLVGWILSILPCAMLFMSAYMKLSGAKDAVEGLAKYGYPVSVLLPLGVIELAAAIVFLTPRVSIFGLAVLTGYLGGACATHVAAGDPTANAATPVVLGVVLWIGFVLRYPDVLRSALKAPLP